MQYVKKEYSHQLTAVLTPGTCCSAKKEARISPTRITTKLRKIKRSRLMRVIPSC